jgi:hypothetical protein
MFGFGRVLMEKADVNVRAAFSEWAGQGSNLRPWD